MSPLLSECTSEWKASWRGEQWQWQSGCGFVHSVSSGGAGGGVMHATCTDISPLLTRTHPHTHAALNGGGIYGRFERFHFMRHQQKIRHSVTNYCFVMNRSQITAWRQNPPLAEFVSSNLSLNHSTCVAVTVAIRVPNCFRCAAGLAFLTKLLHFALPLFLDFFLKSFACLFVFVRLARAALLSQEMKTSQNERWKWSTL